MDGLRPIHDPRIIDHTTLAGDWGRRYFESHRCRTSRLSGAGRASLPRGRADKPALFAAILPRTTNVIATIRFRLPDADDNIAINFRYADASHEDLDRPKWWKDPDKTSAQHNVNEGELDDEMDRSDEFGGVPLRNAIEDRRRIAAMELCIVRKSHGLPRRYDSSYEMTPDALTLTSGYLGLFKPEPTTDPVTSHFGVPVLSTQQPETKYPTTRSMSRRKALAIPEPFRTSTTTLPRTRPCVARLARRSRTASEYNFTESKKL